MVGNILLCSCPTRLGEFINVCVWVKNLEVRISALGRKRTITTHHSSNKKPGIAWLFMNDLCVQCLWLVISCYKKYRVK